jgi:predicted amidohydrolase
MKPLLNLSLLQTNPIWQDIDTNIALLDQWIAGLPKQTDLVIFPEMFLTGFSMDVEKIAQNMNGKGVQWMTSLAQTRQITFMGSLAIRDNGFFYNRMLIASPNGGLQWYDKRHLFRMGGEHEHFSSGNKNTIINIQEWNVMPLVCYDLRFPVWSRNYKLKYDLLVYVANWPQPRHDAFLTLIKARAIENQCFVVAVNRVGADGQGIQYAGGSVVVDPKGKFLTEFSQTGTIINCSISLKELQEYRQKFPTYLDADEFDIE